MLNSRDEALTWSVLPDGFSDSGAAATFFPSHQGIHHVELSASNGAGVLSTASVAVAVQTTWADVAILQPAQRFMLEESSPVTLVATAVANGDDPLPSESFQWISSLSGYLGDGAQG